MALPGSGAISMAQVAAELGIPATGLGLNDSRVRALAGKPSGAISMADLHGKSSMWSCVITVGKETANADDGANLYGYSSGPAINGLDPRTAFGSISRTDSPVGTITHFAVRAFGSIMIGVAGLSQGRQVRFAINSTDAWSTEIPVNSGTYIYDPTDTSNPTNQEYIVSKRIYDARRVGGTYTLFIKFP